MVCNIRWLLAVYALLEVGTAKHLQGPRTAKERAPQVTVDEKLHRPAIIVAFHQVEKHLAISNLVWGKRDPAMLLLPLAALMM